MYSCKYSMNIAEIMKKDKMIRVLTQVRSMAKRVTRVDCNINKTRTVPALPMVEGPIAMGL